MKRAIGVLLLVSTGCGGEAVWNGTYASTGTWKLSGPLENGRTVGDAAADLFLDKLAGLAPVPSFLESKLRDWLSGSLRDPIKTTIDAKVPKELAPDGSLTKLLGSTLVSVTLESTIVLEGDSDELEGNETVTAIEYVINGGKRRVAASALPGQNGVGVTAEWAGEEPSAGRLSIEPHAVTLRYGALVRQLMSDVLQAAELSSLDAQLKAALGCAQLVSTICGGKSGLEIALVGWSYTIGTSDLESACSSAMSAIAERAVGQFELDSKVEVGGSVSWTIPAGSPNITLKSGTDFGGTVNVLPKAIAPRVSVSFTATRQAFD